MPIPDFQTLMRPLLEIHSDGNEHHNRNLISRLSEQFQLSEEERRKMLPSGRAKLFSNRVGWAKTHMAQAGLLESPRRGVSKITDRGRKILRDHPDRIDLRVLKQYEEYREFRNRPSDKESDAESQSGGDTPEESLEREYTKAREETEVELLRQIMSSPPDFLERVVVDLITKMGYGGSRKDAGEAIGHAGDEGIDGTIKEDQLGLDVIYLQAKRWEGTVGRPEIQKFVGALHGKRARKGIFMTTSAFSRDAVDYVANIETKIILIDGRTLARLMFDHDVGVTTYTTYEIKNIDTDYFADA